MDIMNWVYTVLFCMFLSLVFRGFALVEYFLSDKKTFLLKLSDFFVILVLFVSGVYICFF